MWNFVKNSALGKLVWEWLLTFSNVKSLFSSKRFERFYAFMIVSNLFALYMYHGIMKCSISSTDLAIVGGTLLGYAGFNTIQSRKENETGPGNTEKNSITSSGNQGEGS